MSFYDDTESQVNVNSSSTQNYSVTVVARLESTVHKTLAFTFTIPGPADHSRFVRALCYFDNALFHDAQYREQLLSRSYSNTRTDEMFSTMVHAYNTLLKAARQYDFDPIMYIVKATPIVNKDLVSSPNIITELFEAPTPLTYPCTACVLCGRVQEKLEHYRGGIQCCVKCHSR